MLWESKINYKSSLDAGPLQFQLLRPRGYFTNPFRTLSLSIGVIGKTPGLISRNNFVTRILSASAIAIISWQDVTPSSLCSGVKQCGTKRAHNFFRIRRTTALGVSKDSAIILDSIRRSFLTKSATAALFTSVPVYFGWPALSFLLPAPFRLEIENTTWKRLIGSQPHSNKPFAPILVFLSQTDWLWTKLLWQLSVHFRHPRLLKRTNFPRQVIHCRR
jgi:hypothetical protein